MEHLYFCENAKLKQVIREEVDAFLAGDISAQEAADRIQNRGAIVVGE